MRDVKSTSSEILKWELAKTWRLKLGSLEVVTRWRCFPYEKQRHLPVECIREFDWSKTDWANLDYWFLQTFTDSRIDFPRLHAWYQAKYNTFLYLNKLLLWIFWWITSLLKSLNLTDFPSFLAISSVVTVVELHSVSGKFNTFSYFNKLPARILWCRSITILSSLDILNSTTFRHFLQGSMPCIL